MLWIVLFGSFAAAVGYNAKQAGIVDNIYRPETLISDVPDGFAIQLGNRVGRVVGKDDGVCAGAPCKVLKIKLVGDTLAHVLVDGQVYSETWKVKVLSSGVRLVRPDGSYVTAAN